MFIDFNTYCKIANLLKDNTLTITDIALWVGVTEVDVNYVAKTERITF